ncbi:hypothetical protein Q1695_002428 [Nippostrongylus brasiliensis]|nr:hypothetical protein Q1695_002428 [Nippostrongylus brasiliensis]
MRLFLLLCIVAVVDAGFFDFLFGRNKNKETTVVHETHPDTGELPGSRANPNLGDEVHIPSGGHGTDHRNRVTVKKRKNSDGYGCPIRVDAFCQAGKYSYLFSGGKVAAIQNKEVQAYPAIEEVFPSGPHTVNAAVYDEDRLSVVLIQERKVYAYKKTGGDKFVLDSGFPKELPDNVFTPSGAMVWHDKRQMLLSNAGKFALYDEYWNKSLMTARTADYFKNLPDNVRGLSTWQFGKANVFTKNLVFTYETSLNSTAGDGVPVNVFLRCF